jgi:hypothetical protein
MPGAITATIGFIVGLLLLRQSQHDEAAEGAEGGGVRRVGDGGLVPGGRTSRAVVGVPLLQLAPSCRDRNLCAVVGSLCVVVGSLCVVVGSLCVVVDLDTNKPITTQRYRPRHGKEAPATAPQAGHDTAVAVVYVRSTSSIR